MPCIVNENTAASEFLYYGEKYGSYNELLECLQNITFKKRNLKKEDYQNSLTKYFEIIQ